MNLIKGQIRRRDPSASPQSSLEMYMVPRISTSVSSYRVMSVPWEFLKLSWQLSWQQKTTRKWALWAIWPPLWLQLSINHSGWAIQLVLTVVKVSKFTVLVKYDLSVCFMLKNNRKTGMKSPVNRSGADFGYAQPSATHQSFYNCHPKSRITFCRTIYLSMSVPWVFLKLSWQLS